MKILFYDIDNIELEYFLKNSLNIIEPYFFKIPLNDGTYIDEKYSDTEAICVFVQSDLTADTLRQFKNLKYIFLRSTGYSNVDLKYCKAKDIKVCNVPEYGTDSVAEYAFGLLINVSRNILKACSDLKNGIINKESLTGFELKNKNLGVIGAGAIGKRILDIAKAFKMNTFAYDVIKSGYYNYVSLDELLKVSDFIMLCCPLNDSTKYLINRDTIDKMKENAVIINISRGETVEIESMYNAIVNKKLYGAGLDVVECEQTLCAKYQKCFSKESVKSNCLKKYLFSSKLMQMENMIITPHIAYNTYEARKRTVDVTIENIKSVFDINPGAKNLILL